MSEDEKERAWAVIEALHASIGNPLDVKAALKTLGNVAFIIIGKTSNPPQLAFAWINELISRKPN